MKEYIFKDKEAQVKWQNWQDKNKDGYGGACVLTAQGCFELLDEDSTPLVFGYGKHTPHQLICDGDERSNAGGITGFMAGCVAQMITQCHPRGEEFRVKWNGKESVGKKGVKNPALLTIKTK